MEDFQPPKREVSMASALAKYPTQTKKAKGMGPRRELICRICFELGISDKDRTGLYFQTKDIFTDQELLDMMYKAMGWKSGNPAAWFRSMVKVRRKEIKIELEKHGGT